MAAPSHFHLLARPQTLALALPASRALSAPRFRCLRLRPIAALAGGGGGGLADVGELLGRVEVLL
uniref:60 kDa inner membrane protein n=1 Tax=Arundo donax TaxID=35708 RepID=A0A0A9DC05_ARUDO